MMTKLRNAVQHNLPAKILALLVAVVLWLYVMNDQNPAIEGNYTVPVTIENAPDGYQINAAADTVTIRVRGARSLFVAADRSDFHASVRLSDFIEGEKAYTVETSVPYGFELVSVSPDKISVTLDRIVQKTFKAELTASGEPVSGYTVDKITQANETATVEGPRSLVDRVVHIAGHISLAGQSGDFSVHTSLHAIDADGREVSGIALLPESTDVSVRLARGLSRKVVEVQARPRSDLAPHLRLEGITVEPARIEIAGPEDVIGKITSIGTEEFSLSDVHETEKRQVKLRLPAGVTVTDPNVTVEVKVGDMR